MACGLPAAALDETDPKEMMASPTSKMIVELRSFEPKLPKNWLERGAIMIELLEKLCSINIKTDDQTALLAFHAPYDRSVVCASLPSIDLPEILRSQPRGWFSPAMVQRKIYNNINWFISTATFTVPLEFVKGQLLEMRLKRGA